MRGSAHCTSNVRGGACRLKYWRACNICLGNEAFIYSSVPNSYIVSCMQSVMLLVQPSYYMAIMFRYTCKTNQTLRAAIVLTSWRLSENRLIPFTTGATFWTRDIISLILGFIDTKPNLKYASSFINTIVKIWATLMQTIDKRFYMCLHKFSVHLTTICWNFNHLRDYCCLMTTR